MNVNVSESAVLVKAIDEAITHSERQGLPLISIELTPSEWKMWTEVRGHDKKHVYRRIKIVEQGGWKGNV